MHQNIKQLQLVQTYLKERISKNTIMNKIKSNTKSLLFSTLLISLTIIVSACHEKEKSYIIGISQCSEDSWRSKLQAELLTGTYFSDNLIDLRFASTHDDSKEQERQIDSLVATGIDLLIVSPNQVDILSDAIDRAYDKGIPVILFDRKTNSPKYTAYMGANNYEIGSMLGKYIIDKLNGKGNIVEICGLKGSSPADERHKGFISEINRCKDIHIVGTAAGDWTEKSGEMAMAEILKEYNGPIDCIMGGNDRMAIGARSTYLKLASQVNRNLITLGVDALPTPGGGMELVRDSVLTASAIYPTHGDELLSLALKILNHDSFEKEYTLQSSIVNADNADILLLQNKELVRQGNNLQKMHQKVDKGLAIIYTQKMLLFTIIIFTILISCSLIWVIKAYHQKHKLSKRLALEKEKVEQQRDELEEQRDKLIEVRIALQKEHPNEEKEDSLGDDVLTGAETQYREESEFMKRFHAIIDEHLSDSEITVEQLGKIMCLSRVQLYRKVKAMTGLTPNEILRNTRLKRGQFLIQTTDKSISEIAYAVGFSAPSYFTKCYRDYYGKAPSER